MATNVNGLILFKRKYLIKSSTLLKYEKCIINL